MIRKSIVAINTKLFIIFTSNQRRSEVNAGEWDGESIEIKKKLKGIKDNSEVRKLAEEYRFQL